MGFFKLIGKIKDLFTIPFLRNYLTLPSKIASLRSQTIGEGNANCQYTLSPGQTTLFSRGRKISQ